MKIYTDEKAANQESEERKERREQADLLAQQEMAKWAFWMFVAAAFQLGAGIITVAFLWVTFRETRKTANAGIKAAETAERALVDVQRALIVNSKIAFNVGLRNGRIIAYTFDVHLTNTGSTTAKNVTGTSTTVVFDGKMPADFKYPNRIPPEPQGGICGPGVTIVHGLGMAIEDLIAVEKKTKEAFIYGWLEYDDIFATTRRRRTEFCAKIGVMTNPTIIQNPGTSIITFAIYGPYNGIDDDCFYKPGQIIPVGGLPPITQPPPANDDPPTQTYKVTYGS